MCEKLLDLDFAHSSEDTKMSDFQIYNIEKEQLAQPPFRARSG